MTLTRRPAPHMRHSDSITISMADVMFALIPCIAMGCYYYGVRLLINCAIAVASGIATELIISALLRKRATVTDMSAVVTGLIVAMLLPVGVSYTYVILAQITAIIFAKCMFGGVGKNIFNPALVGVAFVTLANTEAVTKLFPQGAELPLSWSVDPDKFGLATGVLSHLSEGEKVSQSLLDLFIGKQAGFPVSACIPMIIVAAAYLLYRRIISPATTFSLVATVSVIAFLLPRGETGLLSVCYELMAGQLLFCGVFCANDPVTTPNTTVGKILFGVGAGLITMLIRYYGNYDEGIVFAILIMNSLSFALDKIIHKMRSRKRREALKSATAAGGV